MKVEASLLRRKQVFDFGLNFPHELLLDAFIIDVLLICIGLIVVLGLYVH